MEMISQKKFNLKGLKLLCRSKEGIHSEIELPIY